MNTKRQFKRDLCTVVIVEEEEVGGERERERDEARS